MSSREQKKISAREKAAQLRAEQLRAERRRRLLIAGAAVAVVLVVMVGLVVAKLTGVGDTPAATPSGQASAKVVSALSVPASVLDEVGTGKAQGGPKKIDAPALTASGKPRVLYVGAEYCPFCAAERWPMAVALARFGKFTGLGVTGSASDDAFPNTPTLSFHGATYASPYLSFTGVETTTNKKVGGNYEPLDSLNAADQKIVDTYDQPPYVSGAGAGGIPFIDIGGTYVSSGANYSPELLAGKTHEQVAASLNDPTSDIAQAVNGSANLFTAAICDVTGNKPGNVCTSAGVTKAAASLGKS